MQKTKVGLTLVMVVNGTLFKDKNRALKVVEKLCENNKKKPVFLVACNVV